MSELLLIDDDQELCELLGSWLTQEGFTVRACHDGQSARQALAEYAPAAVVLDVMLPDGSGLELLKQLRSEHTELPVLMLSARGEPLDRILGLELAPTTTWPNLAIRASSQPACGQYCAAATPPPPPARWNWATWCTARHVAWPASTAVK